MKKDNLLLLETKWKMLFDMILLGLITIICYIAPFASYTYRRESYTITGIELLVGKVIMGGKVTVNASLLMWIYLIVALLLILLSMLFPKIKPKTAGTGILLLGLASFVINVIFSNQVNSILSSAKDPKVG